MINLIQFLVIVFLLTVMFAGETIVIGSQQHLLDWSFCVAAQSN